MAAVFCSSCGRSNAAGSGFCQGCGAPLAAAPAAAAPGTPFQGPPLASPQPGWGQAPGMMPPAPQPQTQAADVRALGEAKVGATLGIVGLLLSVVGTVIAGVYGGLGLGISCDSVTNTCTYPSHGIAFLAGLFALTVVGYIVAILFILRFRMAFQALAPIDRRFDSPASLAILAIVGLVVILLGLGLVLAVESAIIGPCSSGVYTNCYNAVTSHAGLLFGGLGLIVLGAIMLLIGGIMLLIGIWRLGTRYDQSMLKIGAVLLIIPVLDIVGVILIYLGVHDAQRKVGSYPGAPGAGMPVFPSPPPGAG